MLSGRSIQTEECVHDPQRQLRIVRVVHASVLRLHPRDMLHIGHGRGYQPARRGDAPVARQVFLLPKLRGGIRETHLCMVFLPYWFNICLIHISKLLNIGKSVDEEGMFCVEWMTIHLVEGVSGCVGVSEFNNGISMRARLDKMRRISVLDSPIALSGFIVPWQGDIIGLDCGAFPCKLLRDFCQKLLLFCLVNDGNTIDD